jgi:hypothetical protein
MDSMTRGVNEEKIENKKELEENKNIEIKEKIENNEIKQINNEENNVEENIEKESENEKKIDEKIGKKDVENEIKEKIIKKIKETLSPKDLEEFELLPYKLAVTNGESLRKIYGFPEDEFHAEDGEKEIIITPVEGKTEIKTPKFVFSKDAYLFKVKDDVFFVFQKLESIKLSSVLKIVVGILIVFSIFGIWGFRYTMDKKIFYFKYSSDTGYTFGPEAAEKNYYKILGVKEGASQKEIQNRYHELAMK